MPISEYKKQKNLELKKKALQLYKEGLTLRELVPVIGMSYEWIRKGINELSTQKELTSIDKKS